MCHVLRVHRSGYYAWLRTPQSQRAIANAMLLVEIKQFYAVSGNIYGSPRIYRDCKATGLMGSENRVNKLMHSAKLHAVCDYHKVI